MLFGFIPLICGANFLVDGSSSLANKFNIPNIVIGLTIVAFGTSSPELIVNIFSSINQNPDIAIGNVTGSNIFDILFILGLSAVIQPIPLREGVNSDILFSLFLSFILFLFVFTGRWRKIERWEGFVLITSYIVYLIHLID
ncbi:sodium:calcium antiporter [Propionigenium maris]|uniref:sodium:calcium antiporter n=1 Tax=Propionigenium maris TaxID=45622 RepID=UPI0035A25921